MEAAGKKTEKNGKNTRIPLFSTEEESKALHKRIKVLEEELKRKQQEIEKIKQENHLLFKTAIKRAERELASKKGEK